MKYFPLLLPLFLFACSSPVSDKKEITAKDPSQTQTLFAFEKDGRYGYKDAKGKEILAPKYMEVFTDTFDHRMALVADSVEGVIAIDHTGKKLFTPFIFDNGPDYFSEGVFRYTENNKMGFANLDSIVLPAKYDFVTPFHEDLACFGSGFKMSRGEEGTSLSGGKWGFINMKGDTVIAPRFDEPAEFKNGKADVKEKGKEKTISKDGKEIKRESLHE
ncbi:MAG TPA: WG repeat-containing protein [Bacteroidia bacterium]|jgi:hypothetical protein